MILAMHINNRDAPSSKNLALQNRLCVTWFTVFFKSKDKPIPGLIHLSCLSAYCKLQQSRHVLLLGCGHDMAPRLHVQFHMIRKLQLLSQIEKNVEVHDIITF